MRVTHAALLAVVAVVAAVALGGIAWHWPTGDADPDPTDEFVLEEDQRDATLIDVVEVSDGSGDPTMLPGATVVEVTAEFEDTGETVAFHITDETGDTYEEGQKVRVASVPGPEDGRTYYVSDFRRGTPLGVLALMFVGAVVAFGRFQGVRALAGLALTFALIIGFIVPAILDGRSPVSVALFGALAIMIVTLYLSHGFGAKTSAAVVGTAGALLLTVALAAFFTDVASLTGFTSEDARLANYEVGGLSLRGLLLAGIIIGGLGVLDDVTMSQASTVFALRRADPSMPFRRLFTEGLSVGRDHIAATVNTLFLAYAGASLPLLILLTTSYEPLGGVLTSEVVAVEIVRTLVGSLGLIAAVPLTTALAAAVALGGAPIDEDDHAHGHLPEGSLSPAAASVPASASAPASGSGSGSADDASGRDPSDSAWEADLEEERWVERLRTAYRTPPDRPDPEG